MTSATQDTGSGLCGSDWITADDNGATSLTSPLRNIPAEFKDPTTLLLLAQRRLYRAHATAEGAEARLQAPSLQGLEIEPEDVLPPLELIAEEVGEALGLLRQAVVALRGGQGAAS